MATPVRPSRSIELTVAVGVCVAGAVLVYAMLLAEGVGVRDELMLAAPEAARPGETLALRAYLYHDPDSAMGPTPEAGDVDVELRDGAHVLARASLTAGASMSLEGSIGVPGDAHGTLYLVARAHDEGGASLLATVARPLAVADDAPPAAHVERVASPLAHFSLGPLQQVDAAPPLAVVTEPGMLAPVPVPPPHVDTLDAWVVGGICVPEVRCLVAVDVGLPSIDPQLTECAGVEVLEPLPVTGEASRYHVVPLVVHGPEGTCNLTAVSLAEGSRGAHLAYRTIRFPVALATPYLGLGAAMIDSGAPELSAVDPPGRDGVVVDVFHAGRWRDTISLPAGTDPARALNYVPCPRAVLPSGVYLLEARSDALPTTYVAPRLLVVGGDTALAEADPAPARVGARGAELTFFLAAHEQDGLVLPSAASGLAGDRARLESHKRAARTIAFVGITVGILLLVVTVLRRGLAADAEARALLVASGLPAADDAAARRWGRLTVILMVLALGLACATGAALIAAHQLAIDTDYSAS